MAPYSMNWTHHPEEESFPAIREALGEDYAALPADQVADLVETLYPGVDAEDIENFFSSLRHAGRGIGRVARRALPGVIQGATAGAALGPWGALAGGLAGGALSAVGSGMGRQTRPRSSNHLARAAALGRTAPRRAPAAARLLRAINRPEVTRALSALALGGAGRGSVRVGGANVPVSAIANALRGLLEQVQEEHHAAGLGRSSASPTYLLDSDGEFAVDPTDDNARAERVLQLLDAADREDEMADARLAWVEAYEEGFEASYEDFDDESDGDDAEDAAALIYPGVHDE